MGDIVEICSGGLKDVSCNYLGPDHNNGCATRSYSSKHLGAQSVRLSNELMWCQNVSNDEVNFSPKRAQP